MKRPPESGSLRDQLGGVALADECTRHRARTAQAPADPLVADACDPGAPESGQDVAVLGVDGCSNGSGGRGS